MRATCGSACFYKALGALYLHPWHGGC